jgi:hypothetical protein
VGDKSKGNLRTLVTCLCPLLESHTPCGDNRRLAHREDAIEKNQTQEQRKLPDTVTVHSIFCSSLTA